jgi:cell division protein FtsZ
MKNIMDTDFEIIMPDNWDELAQGATIKVIGVGGGGNNAVNHMSNSGIVGVDFLVCNTDGQVLRKSPIQNKIQLGDELTRGRGAGCDPEIGKQAAIESTDKIKVALGDNKKTEMVFITAGMGGGTGTGAAPVIAQVAKEMGILTVAIVTLPFRDEGQEPQRRALEGIKELKNYVDALLLISNNKLYEMFGDLSLREGFKKADEVLACAAKGIAEIITKPGYINVDFADVKKVMANSGVALLGTGHGEGEKRAVNAVEAALSSPLLNNNSIKGAKNILVNITTSNEIKYEIRMSELGDIMSYIQREAGNADNIKRGVVYDDMLADELIVTIVATGFKVNDIPELKPDADKDKEKIPLNPPHQNVQLEINNVIQDNNDTSFLTNEIVENIVDKNDCENIEKPFPDKEKQIYVKEKEVDLRLQVEEFLDIQTNNNTNIVKKQLTGLKKQEILLLEKVPAYKRKNIEIETEQQSNQCIATETLEKSATNEYILRSNNAYLNPEVD